MDFTQKNKEKNLVSNKEKFSEISSALAIMSVISLVIMTVIDVSYKTSCYKYFGIPEKYFFYDFKTQFVKVLLYFRWLIVGYLICSVVYYILSNQRKSEEEKNEEKKQKYSFKIIFEKIAKLEPIDIIKMCILVLYKFFNICLLCLWSSVLLYIVLDCIFGYSLNTDICTTNILFTIIFFIAIFLDFKKKLLNNLFLIINFCCFLSMIFLVGIKTIHPENKNYYEVTIVYLNGKDEQVVVLSDNKDKCLVVKYEEKDNKVIFYTKDYYFINKENRKFNIKNFENKTIEKNDILK